MRRRHCSKVDPDAPAGQLGFRHLDFVELRVEDGAVRASAVGVVHRDVREVPISLALATRLVAAGTPVVALDGQAHSRASADAPTLVPPPHLPGTIAGVPRTPPRR